MNGPRGSLGDSATDGAVTSVQLGSAERDLDTRSQIHNLVVAFYREVVFDELLAPVFEDVAEVDWAEHIPRLIDYWCRVLLGEPGYDGRILQAHHRVHEVEAFGPELFQRWLALFTAAVDEGWRGPIADRAKDHAQHMAAVMARRLAVTAEARP